MDLWKTFVFKVILNVKVGGGGRIIIWDRLGPHLGGVGGVCSVQARRGCRMWQRAADPGQHAGGGTEEAEVKGQGLDRTNTSASLAAKAS